ncbi:hypothetical protein [Variovorax sp. 38R]|uniref:hypothetical protein n=1 Tax=Variovorax sp. 38R TaxID=2774875 RepID=UPI001780C1A9|nr:hypothetical protein [Variovorax sp. 38R]QOF76065.1 hypothetical protein IG196_16775 [Variovorax sp. 38R]
MASIYRADFSAVSDGDLVGKTIDGLTWQLDSGSPGSTITGGVLTARDQAFVEIPGTRFNAGATQIEIVLQVDLSAWRGLDMTLFHQPNDSYWCGLVANTFYGDNSFTPYYPPDHQGGSTVSYDGYLNGGPVELRVTTDLTTSETVIRVNGITVVISSAGEPFDPTTYTHRLRMSPEYDPQITLIEVLDDTGVVTPPFWTGFKGTYEVR